MSLAPMTELADVADLKSADRIIVRVQIPLGALNAYARFLCGEVPQTFS